MVSELVTNGVQHGGTSFEVAIHRTDAEIRIEVTDRGGGTPAMRSPTPDDAAGRGLRIVDMLAKRWGVSHLAAAGKTVWCTLSAPPLARETTGCAGR
jgi:anti-sigma regulatory factor (Ser/Thr protein kinase)